MSRQTVAAIQVLQSVFRVLNHAAEMHIKRGLPSVPLAGSMRDVGPRDVPVPKESGLFEDAHSVPAGALGDERRANCQSPETFLQSQSSQAITSPSSFPAKDVSDASSSVPFHDNAVSAVTSMRVCPP